MNEEEKSRVEKVSALLAKAERTENEHEAEAFFEKAQELMSKWAIDDAMLRAAGGGKAKADPLIVRRVDLPNSYFNANVDLIVCIARANDVKLVMGRPYRGSQGYVRLAGHESDVKNVESLYVNLLIQVTREVRKARQEPGDWSSPYVFRNTFRSAFASRIGERLQEAKRRATATARTEHGSGMDLVLRDKGEVVSRFYHEQFPKTRASRGGQRSWSGSGAAAGRAAGDRADIGNSRLGGNRKAIK